MIRTPYVSSDANVGHAQGEVFGTGARPCVAIEEDSEGVQENGFRGGNLRLEALYSWQYRPTTIQHEFN